MAAVRDPKRPGGKLLRSNIRAAPAAKKKRLMTVKKGVKATTEKVTDNQGEDMTPAVWRGYTESKMERGTK